VISFHQLIGTGGKDGARASFEALVGQLVGLRYRGMRVVEANPGDWGLDVTVGELDGIISVWQAKFFIDGIEESQKGQIRGSFKQVTKKAAEEGFSLNTWTLCVPVNLDPDALKWWTKWSKAREKETGIALELEAQADLETLLIAPEASHVLRPLLPHGRPRPRGPSAHSRAARRRLLRGHALRQAASRGEDRRDRVR
jgi:hypothetical protein